MRHPLVMRGKCYAKHPEWNRTRVSLRASRSNSRSNTVHRPARRQQCRNTGDIHAVRNKICSDWRQRLSYLAHPVGIYGATRKSSWVGGKRERLFETLTFNSDGYVLVVRQYGDRRAYGELWSVQRDGAGVLEVLALDADPIFWTYPRVAKAMAKLCHPNPRHEARCLHWIPTEGEKRGAFNRSIR